MLGDPRARSRLLVRRDPNCGMRAIEEFTFASIIAASGLRAA
jgi:hypothetical protein